MPAWVLLLLPMLLKFLAWIIELNRKGQRLKPKYEAKFFDLCACFGEIRYATNEYGVKNNCTEAVRGALIDGVMVNPSKYLKKPAKKKTKK